jgi:hypothetical protein
MVHAKQSAKEQNIVLRCLKSVDYFIDDDEKHSRLGLDSDELHDVIACWPNIDDRDTCGNGFLAINNAMNEVCHGIRIESNDWSKWFDTPMVDVQETHRKWCEEKGISGGIR